MSLASTVTLVLAREPLWRVLARPKPSVTQSLLSTRVLLASSGYFLYWCSPASPSLTPKLLIACSFRVNPRTIFQVWSSGTGLLPAAVRPWGSHIPHPALVGIRERRSLQAELGEIHSAFPQLGSNISPQIMLPKVEMPLPCGNSVLRTCASHAVCVISKRLYNIKKEAKKCSSRTEH